MIVEGIVTTLGPSGELNVAPMGPEVAGDFDRFVLRPFRTSTTFRNLKATGAGVFHVTDDAWLVARAAIKAWDPAEPVPTRPASAIDGRIVDTSGRFYEFRVVSVDDSRERTSIEVETVARGEQAIGLSGWNRARHAVVEASILATRVDILDPREIIDQMDRLAAPVRKTGGPDEARAFALLDRFVRDRLGVRSGDRPYRGTRIALSTRLHFGLLSWGARHPRQFGGAGLMVRGPGTTISAEPSTDWAASGPFADRVLDVARTVSARMEGRGIVARRRRFVVESAAREHAGLGVGTQVSLAVARLLTTSTRWPDPTVRSMAELTGRGRRSGVGVHGFDLGGLIVDGGRRPGDPDVPTLVARHYFPGEWWVLVVVPPGDASLHGQGEVRAFAELPDWSDATVDRLARLTLLGLVPSALDRDLDGFGAALEEIQDRVGEGFAASQGGVFSSQTVLDLVTFLRSRGLRGVGQSSWGPTVYGFTAEGADYRASLARQVLDRTGWPEGTLTWTTASDRGSSLEWYDDPIEG